MLRDPVRAAPHAQLDRGPDKEPDRRPEALDGTDAMGRGVHARRLVIGGVTLFAAAPRTVIARPLRDALVPLLVAMAILGGLLATATWIQLRLGLQPLERMRAQVAAIRAGAATRLDEDQPTELQGLAVELNALADDRRSALATARQSAANLAHALKTPVATLALSLRDEPAKAAQVARIDATIRHHLSRARAGAADVRASTPIVAAVVDMVEVVGRLHAASGLTIATDIETDIVTGRASAADVARFDVAGGASVAASSVASNKKEA